MRISVHAYVKVCIMCLYLYLCIYVKRIIEHFVCLFARVCVLGVCVRAYVYLYVYLQKSLCK